MKKFLAKIAITATLAMPLVAGAEMPNACVPGPSMDGYIYFYTVEEPTGTPTPTETGLIDNLGGALSGGFYGNTSNAGDDPDAPESGNGVTPSISPGPQTVGGDGPGSGTSIGDLIQSCPFI